MPIQVLHPGIETALRTGCFRRHFAFSLCSLEEKKRATAVQLVSKEENKSRHSKLAKWTVAKVKHTLMVYRYE